MSAIQVELATYVAGDDVSYGFNGDWYPCGKVARFTKSRRFMFTDGGEKFVRDVIRDTRYNEVTHKREDFHREVYRSPGGTWTIAKGIHKEQNPHF